MFGLPSLYAYLIGGAMLAVVSFGGGYWTAHKFDSIPYNSLLASKAALQSEYDGYKASVATNSAKASADATARLSASQKANNDLQAQLSDYQRTANAKTQELQKLLAAAKPGDIRPIGPVAGAYYSRLRGETTDPGHTANATNP